jgi:ketosteroid isomerase-like protein
MSQENVELVRPIYEAFNHRDWNALFRDADPQFAFTYHNVGTDAGIRRGREEVLAFAEEYGGAFEELLWEPEEFFDRDDRVVVFVSVRSRPRGGGVDLVVRNGHLWTIRDGVVLSMESFPRQKAPSKPPGCRSRRPFRSRRRSIHRRVPRVEREDIEAVAEAHGFPAPEREEEEATCST